MRRLLATLVLAVAAPLGTSVSAPVERTAITTRDEVAASVATSSSPPARVLPALGDARAVAAAGDTAWIATAGGLVRVGLTDRKVARYGLEGGLDSLDVRGVRAVGAEPVVDTATGQCVLSGDRFQCQATRGGPPRLESAPPERVGGERARAVVGDRVVVARSDATAVLLGPGRARTTIALGPSAPPSFLTSVAAFRGHVFATTFRDGLYRARVQGVDVGALAPVEGAPFRMANALASVRSASDGVERLFIAAHEGLFVSRDGATFALVPAIGARSLTGVMEHDGLLWVASTEALYSMSTDGRGRVRSAMLRPAGSRSIQSLVAGHAGVVWLATEDRGMVRVEGGAATPLDALSGLASSWMVSARSDGAGGVLAATLRHGAVRLLADGSSAPTAVAANAWTLSTARWDDASCVGSQGGVRCAFDSGGTVALSGLPSLAAHGLFVVDGALWVSTDAGLAVYDRTALRPSAAPAVDAPLRTQRSR